MRARCRAPPPPGWLHHRQLFPSWGPEGVRGSRLRWVGDSGGGVRKAWAAEQVALVTLTGGHQAWPG